MTTVSPWVCPTCDAPREDRYCPACGEQPLRPQHLTLVDFGRQLIIGLSSVDGKLLRTLRLLIAQPGALTSAYIAGRRTLFLRPLSLFLITNGLFFAIQSMVRTNIFSPSLNSHLHRQDWSALAQTLVARRLAAKATSLEAFAALYDPAAVLHAKSLIIMMVFMFTIILALLFGKARRPFGMHVVFSLHLCAFQLLLFSLILLVSQAVVQLGGRGLESAAFDIGATIAIIVASTVYLRAATRTVYGSRGALALIRTALLALLVSISVVAYRFLVFLITLYTV